MVTGLEWWDHVCFLLFFNNSAVLSCFGIKKKGRGWGWEVPSWPRFSQTPQDWHSHSRGLRTHLIGLNINIPTRSSSFQAICNTQSSPREQLIYTISSWKASFSHRSQDSLFKKHKCLSPGRSGSTQKDPHSNSTKTYRKSSKCFRQKSALVFEVIRCTNALGNKTSMKH